VRNYDLDFLKKFSMVLGFLAALTVALILFAHYLQGTLPRDPDPSVTQRTAARIAPAGAVYAGATGAAAQAAASAAATAAAASQVAYGGTLDGSVIFGNLCGGCHTSGAGGAPMLVAAGMGARAAKGVELLHQHAIEGFTGSAGAADAAVTNTPSDVAGSPSPRSCTNQPLRPASSRAVTTPVMRTGRPSSGLRAPGPCTLPMGRPSSREIGAGGLEAQPARTRAQLRTKAGRGIAHSGAG
jgi:cytochrome c5